MSASLADRVSSGDRRALAQAITLVESTRDDHREEAAELLDALLPRTGRSLRVAVTGSPGAGKSTFIEALGLRLLGAGHRVAVLAIDPSSQRSGGSILGDKTRMEDLTRRPDAYVRPSPSGGTLGGVARRTRDALLLCEAAGYDVVLVETVGVGQSETAAADLVDCMLLLATPGAGDELQGIKRGIMELADVIAVTKSDGDLLPSAQRAASDLRHAVHLLRPKHPGWSVPVLPVSAVAGIGVDEVWQAVEALRDHLRADGRLDELRSGQAVTWLWNEIQSDALRAFREDEVIAARAREEETAVRAGTTSSSAAARRLIRLHRSAAAP
ncbi:MAG: methylmalonyl Co-A mutase-associated GTPase MeaB [Acidimicrobiales bacterium]|nr:methylmalonyl Co-A mutase-associated GTPase MeaB [Acidimicrobiales bacterium]